MVQESRTLTATLNQLAGLDRYNGWIFDKIRPALGRRVLEVGSGTGNITRFLAGDGRQVVATEVVPSYRDHLVSLFRSAPLVEVSQFDLNCTAPPELVAAPFDSVVCLNVLEHIEDDLAALREMWRVLRPGGELALLVPAHPVLYGRFDQAVGHFRRYSKPLLLDLLRVAGFQVKSTVYFNCLAVLPWLLNGRILRRDYLPAGQTSLADRLVPLLKLERFIGPPCGLSLIAIAKKHERCHD